MKDITENFGTLYHPVSALVIYQTDNIEKDTYVEHFDMDVNGNPVNAHPLTLREAKALAKALKTEEEKSKGFLQSKGILPANILHVNTGENGSVLWHTKSCKKQLFFTDSLGIPNGLASIPPILWHASKSALTVFALASHKRPSEKTTLYHAPFFNIYEEGNVCMGTVNVNIKTSASVEAFTAAWENYFFESYFSHLINSHNPIKGNMVSLWKELVKTGKPFPKEVLIKTNKTIKNLL